MSRGQRRRRGQRLSLVERRRIADWRVRPRAYSCTLTATLVYGILTTWYTHKIGDSDAGLLGFPEEFGSHMYEHHHSHENVFVGLGLTRWSDLTVLHPPKMHHTEFHTLGSWTRPWGVV